MHAALMQTVARIGAGISARGMTHTNKKKDALGWEPRSTRTQGVRKRQGKTALAGNRPAAAPAAHHNDWHSHNTINIIPTVRTGRQAMENGHTERTQSSWQSATVEIEKKNGDQSHVPAAISSQLIACLTTIAKRHIRAIQHIMAHHTREGSITGARSRAESPSVVVRQFFIRQSVPTGRHAE